MSTVAYFKMLLLMIWILFFCLSDDLQSRCKGSVAIQRWCYAYQSSCCVNQILLQNEIET